MLKTKLTIHHLRINRPELRKTFDKQIQTEMRNAARAWLVAVYPKVPVWTGMARGSLIPLGHLLHIPIPIERSDTAHPSSRGSWTGEPLGKFQFQFFKTVYRFRYSTGVQHFEDNEQFRAPSYMKLIHPTPWHAFEAGTVAFENYIKKNLKANLPKIKSFSTEFVTYDKS